MNRDREILMTAVKHNGLALYCVSNDIRGEKDIVLESVRGNFKSFELLPLDLWVTVILFLMQQIRTALHYNMQIWQVLTGTTQKCPPRFVKYFRAFTRRPSLYTIIREKTYFFQYGLLQ